MATVTGLTAARMTEIEDASVVSGEIDEAGHLILTTHGGDDIDAGYVIASVPDASTTVEGIVELATNAETITGSDTVRAVTPAAFAAGFAAAFTAAFATAFDAEFPSNFASEFATAIAATALNALSDAVISSPALDQVLQYDGTHWVNKTTPHFTGATTGDDVFQSMVTGDTNDRFVIDADGRLNWGPGNATRDVYWKRQGAAAVSTNGDVVLETAGKGIKITESGAAAKMGAAALTGGTVVVNTTAVTANSRIFLMNNTNGGTAGFLRVSARTPGTSFTILSSSGTDTSTIAWLIVEPA